ncbi:hypothetical protein LDENG_00206730 [Lucifuga dentata]|nr:hypothetical protein LDENG_00206730 [Lucifuga dentata]
MKTWVDSRDDCQTKGAHLVVINSEQEQRDLYRLNGNEWLLFWIGLSDRDTPGTYEWVDGSAPATLYWQSGQPDDGGPNKKEECVEMYHHNPVLNSWNDAPCEHKLHFLCEKKCINDM